MANLEQALKAAIAEALKGVHTCLPGFIDTFDTGTGKATVTPALRLTLKDGSTIDYPKIVSVPVIFPRSTGFSLTFPIKKGDSVLVLFTERAISRWLRSGGTVDPLDPRRHDLSDAVAIPGLYPFSEGVTITDPDSMELVYNDASIVIAKNGVVTVDNGSGKFVLKADGQLDVNDGNLTVDV